MTLKTEQLIQKLLEVLVNDRKEERANAAVVAFVKENVFFDGSNATSFTNKFFTQMELGGNDKNTITKQFILAVDPSLRDQIRSLPSFTGNEWELFSKEVCQVFQNRDSERVTYNLFVEWVNRPKKKESPKELMKKFEDLHSRLDAGDAILLQKKCWLFIRAASRDIQREITREMEITATGDIKENWEKLSQTVKRMIILEEKEELCLLFLLNCNLKTQESKNSLNNYRI